MINYVYYKEHCAMSFSRKVSEEISLYFSLDVKENNVLLDFQILLGACFL